MIHDHLLLPAYLTCTSGHCARSMRIAFTPCLVSFQTTFTLAGSLFQLSITFIYCLYTFGDLIKFLFPFLYLFFHCLSKCKFCFVIKCRTLYCFCIFCKTSLIVTHPVNSHRIFYTFCSLILIIL